MYICMKGYMISCYTGQKYFDKKKRKIAQIYARIRHIGSHPPPPPPRLIRLNTNTITFPVIFIISFNCFINQTHTRQGRIQDFQLEGGAKDYGAPCQCTSQAPSTKPLTGLLPVPRAKMKALRF